MNKLKNLIFHCFVFISFEANSKTFFIELISRNQNDHSISSEQESLRVSAEVAVKKFKEDHISCPGKLEFLLPIGDESDFLISLKKVETDRPTVVVGFGKSQYALLLAKYLNGKKISGLSFGSTTSEFHKFNSRFFSLSNPISVQWSTIEGGLLSRKCHEKNTLFLFDKKSLLSSYFRELKSLSSFKRSRETSVLSSDVLGTSECVVIAEVLSAATREVAKVLKATHPFRVFGIGEWGMVGEDQHPLSEIVRKSDKILSVDFPSVELPRKCNVKQREVVKNIRDILKRPISLIELYAFEATYWGLYADCFNLPIEGIKEKIISEKFFRDFYGISESSNFLSKMKLKDLKKEEFHEVCK